MKRVAKRVRPEASKHLAQAPQGGQSRAPRLEWQRILVGLCTYPSSSGARLAQSEVSDENPPEEVSRYVHATRQRCGHV